MPVVKPFTLEQCPKCREPLHSVNVTGNTREGVNIHCPHCGYPLASFG